MANADIWRREERDLLQDPLEYLPWVCGWGSVGPSILPNDNAKQHWIPSVLFLLNNTYFYIKTQLILKACDLCIVILKRCVNFGTWEKGNSVLKWKKIRNEKSRRWLVFEDSHVVEMLHLVLWNMISHSQQTFSFFCPILIFSSLSPSISQWYWFRHNVFFSFPEKNK